MKKVKLELLVGNQGYVITINEYRITPTRHNGIMNVIKCWEIDESDIKNALAENLTKHNSRKNQSTIQDNLDIQNESNRRSMRKNMY